MVEPHLSASERRTSSLFQGNFVYLSFGQQVTHGLFPLDVDGTEIPFKRRLLDAGRRTQHYTDDFCLSVRIGGEVHDFRAWSTLRYVVFPVANDGSNIETFDIIITFLSVTVDDVIDGTLVVFLEYVDVQDVLSDEQFVGHADNFVFTVFVEDNYIVDVGTVAYILVFLQSGTDETFLTVDIQFFVGFGHLGSHDGIEVAYFRAAREVLTIFLFQALIPVDGIFRDMCQVIVYLFQFRFQACDELIRLVLVELQDTCHLDFHQAENVFFGHFAYELRIVRCQAFVDVLASRIHGVSLFELLVFIDTFLDEDFFQ